MPASDARLTRVVFTFRAATYDGNQSNYILFDPPIAENHGGSGTAAGWRYLIIFS